MNPQERLRLIVELQAALDAVRRARRLAPDDPELRGALMLLKRALVRLDCPGLRDDPFAFE